VKDLKFCPNCGESLKEPNPKFCTECGEKLQSLNTPNEQQVKNSSKPSTFTEEVISPKLSTYRLCTDLENTTASILEKMGYSVEKRKRLPTKSGATA
jgi:hypothetical protein